MISCPKCGQTQSIVIDSRPGKDNSIRRRRECEWCGNRFTTYENIVGRQTRRELWYEIRPRLLKNLEKAIKQAVVDSFKEDA